MSLPGSAPPLAPVQTMTDLDLPELPSDEELGISGESLEDLQSEPPPGGPTSTSTPRPVPRWRGPLTLAVLVGLTWASSPERALPRTRAANAPDTVFSSGRALAQLVEITRRPHPIGSPEHTRVRQDLVERLRHLGLDPTVQTATPVRVGGATAVAATVRNIVARVPGTQSTGAVLVTAHYDAVPRSGGAADDGSGLVSVLESLRALSAGPPLRNDLIVLFTDAEEEGLFGARAFVGRHPWMADVAVVVALDMRGAAGPSIMFETGPDNGWVVRALQAGSPGAYANSLSYEVYRRLPNDTDFTPFRQAGVKGLNFAAIGRPDVYHQATDVPANLNEATLQHQGANLLGMVRELGARDLSNVNAPELVYVRLPGVGIVAYPSTWVLPLAALLAIVTVLVSLWARRRGARSAGLLVGLGLAVLAVALAAAAGWGLFTWVRRYHGEFGSLTPAFHREGAYVLALGAAAFTLVTGLFGLARRRYTLAELSLGAAVVPLAAALFVSFAAPLAAMNLQWPALAALIGVAWVTRLPGDRRPGGALGVLLVLPAAIVLAFLVPVVELVWVAMGFTLAPVLGALLALTLVQMLPALDALAPPGRGWAPAAGLVATLAFVGLGLLGARPTADRPEPSTLIYLLDREAGEARWATVSDAGLAWARERVGPLADEADLADFGLRRGPYWVGPAPTVDAPLPDIRVLQDTLVSDRRRVRVALRFAVGAERVRISVPDGVDARFVAVADTPLAGLGGEGPSATTPAVTTVLHWGVPDGALVLELEQGIDTAEVVLDVVEGYLRPAELLGEEVFRRPDTLIPNARTMSDAALFRTLLRLGRPASAAPSEPG